MIRQHDLLLVISHGVVRICCVKVTVNRELLKGKAEPRYFLGGGGVDFVYRVIRGERRPHTRDFLLLEL